MIFFSGKFGAAQEHSRSANLDEEYQEYRVYQMNRTTYFGKIAVAQMNYLETLVSEMKPVLVSSQTFLLPKKNVFLSQ